MSHAKTSTPPPSVASAENPAPAPNSLPPVPTASWEAVRKLKEQNPMVEYRPYPKCPNYLVGSDGTIWNSIYRNRCVTRILDFPKPVKCGETTGGYLRVTICNGSTKTNTKAHVVVLETFKGERPPGLQAAHNDGGNKNNAASNLRWATPKDNTCDKFRHGTMLRGERFGMAKLTNAQVLEIRVMPQSCSEIASKFNVCRDTIRRIKNRTTWTHI